MESVLKMSGRHGLRSLSNVLRQWKDLKLKRSQILELTYYNLLRYNMKC